MNIVFPHCAGLDVHKKSIMACQIHSKLNGRKEHLIREFGTTTQDLLRLLDWLLESECTHVAMESTGEFWKPVYNILEGSLEILLVNARHIKAVPGRKTDVKDAEWIADLLRHGLLKASFVPPRPQRMLRDLTRQRTNLVRDRVSIVNRIQKVLEDANLKLSSVVADITCISARAMLDAIVAGETDPALMAQFARGRMRQKLPELEQALIGRVYEHHRFMLAQHLTYLDFLDQQIATFDQRILDHLAHFPTVPDLSHDTLPPTSPELRLPPLSAEQAITLLDTIPGVDHRTAEVIIAEIGIDMSRFPSANHLASWAGVAPGNNQSAGKQRSGKTPPGNHTLRTALTQAAHAAARTRRSYLSAQYHRLAARRGKKRAIIAVAHSILVAIYHMLSRQEPYHDLGDHFFDERKRETVVNRLVRRLQKMGYEVALESVPAPATTG